MYTVHCSKEPKRVTYHNASAAGKYLLSAVYAYHMGTIGVCRTYVYTRPVGVKRKALSDDFLVQTTMVVT